MHFLKKMMTVVIMLMAGLSGQGWCAAIAATGVDFPLVETPGHKGFVKATHNVNPVFPDKNIPLANDGDNFTWIQVPNANNANIYFPGDGRQPTTPEAAEWSCANINNSLTSPITEWYMRMFGWADPTVRGQVPLQMGFAPLAAGVAGPAPQTPTAIITFDASMNKFKDKFWDTFRQIASTSVGRVLLYRILIEIHRQEAGIGIVEKTLPSTNVIPSVRNKNRSIIIKWKTRFCFFQYYHCINVNFDAPPLTTVIGKKYDTYSYITTNQSTFDIDLCHEMIHWYHILRHPERIVSDSCIDLDKLPNSAIYKNYWGILETDSTTETQRKNSMDPWYRAPNPKIIDGEEIRTILGPGERPVYHSNFEYIEGDDLSENLYRACFGQPLRFGHSSSAFYEDNRVLDKVIKVTLTNINRYTADSTTTWVRKNNFIDMKYRPPYNERGLGDSYYKIE